MPPSPVIVGIATVKNEADVIEAFVRHNLAWLSRLIVLDNGSSDQTFEILRSLNREGLPLDILEDATLGKYQSERMTTMMRDLAVGKNNADWVMPLDADEFIVAPAGKSLVPEDLGQPRLLNLFWQVYVPQQNDDASVLNPVQRIRHRLVQQSNIAKAFIPRDLAAAPQAVLKQGNHDLMLGDKVCRLTPHPYVQLAHFPIRSPGHFLAKVAINSLQYNAMGSQLNNDKGPRYRAPYELLLKDPIRFLANHRHEAERYVTNPTSTYDSTLIDDPLKYLAGELKYTTALDDHLRGWIAILHYADELSRRYGSFATCASNQHSADLVSRQAEVVAGLRAQVNRQLVELENKERWIRHQHDDIERLRAERPAWKKLAKRLQRLTSSPFRRIGKMFHKAA